MKKLQDLSGFIISVLFFAVTGLSLIFFNREPGRESVAENRNLAEFPLKKDGVQRSPSQLKTELQAWFEDNLGLRDGYLTISGILNYNLLHRAKTSKVEIGNEGFLYLSDEGNLNMETERAGDFIAKLPGYAAAQQSMSDRLKQRGIDYVFMITPGKPSVYPEYVASRKKVQGETIGDAMYEYLAENTDVHVFWPKKLLIDQKDNPDGELIYLKTDTHWTTYGRNIAYRDFIAALNKWGVADAVTAEVRFYKEPEPFVGDLSNMMGPVTFSGKRLEEESFTDWQVVSPAAKPVEQGERYEEFKKLLVDKKVYNPELCAMYHNDNAPKRSVMICGDSMIGICLLPELAESFSDLAFIWSYRVDKDFIDLIQPDLIISQYGERELPLRLDEAEGF